MTTWTHHYKCRVCGKPLILTPGERKTLGHYPQCCHTAQMEYVGINMKPIPAETKMATFICANCKAEKTIGFNEWARDGNPKCSCKMHLKKVYDVPKKTKLAYDWCSIAPQVKWPLPAKPMIIDMPKKTGWLKWQDPNCITAKEWYGTE